MMITFSPLRFDYNFACFAGKCFTLKDVFVFVKIAVPLTGDDLALQDAMRKVFLQQIVRIHFFNCVNGQNDPVLPCAFAHPFQNSRVHSDFFQTQDTLASLITETQL